MTNSLVVDHQVVVVDVDGGPGGGKSLFFLYIFPPVYCIVSIV